MPTRTTRSSGRRPLRSDAGMTLIEILVAVTLLGLLSGGIVMALQMASGAWQSTRSRLMLDRRIATANSLLHSVFSGMVFAQAETAPQAEFAGQRFLFFQGEPLSMRFVSSFSIREGYRGGLQITELSIVQARQGSRVLLNQLPYLGPRSAGILVARFVQDPSRLGSRAVFRPIRQMPTSLIIADELRECRFSYLRKSNAGPDATAWAPIWDVRNELPEAVAVNLLPRDDPARLLPVSIVTPVRAKGLVRRRPR